MPEANFGIGANTLACPKPQMPLTTYRPASVAALGEERPLTITGMNREIKSKSQKAHMLPLGVYNNTWLKAMQFAPNDDTCRHRAWAILQPWLCPND